jgi:hypothetical protein
LDIYYVINYYLSQIIFLIEKIKENGIEKGRNGEEMKGSGGKAGEVNIGQKKKNDKTGMAQSRAEQSRVEKSRAE